MMGRWWTTMVALAFVSAPAAAASTLSTGADAPPLLAWVAYCDREPAECAVDLAEATTIPLIPENMDLIEVINRHVNRTISPVQDEDHWGVIDRWNLPEDGRGDCEDIQLLKRKLLIEAGLPRRALRMTVVLDAMGQGHAVLMVRTDRGDLILDNLSPHVLRWSEAGYRFVKREGQDHTGWVWFVPEAPRHQVMVVAARD
jgi:predicted transglutaminase-like cysteine proteinase